MPHNFVHFTAALSDNKLCRG